MKRLHAVGAIAGHATRLANDDTDHLSAWSRPRLYEHVRATLPPLDAVVYAQLLGRHYASVKRFLKDERQPDPASAAALRPWIIKELPTRSHPPPDPQTVVLPRAPSQQPRTRLTVNDIPRILTDYDDGYPLAVIAKRSAADEPRCEALIDAARRIASIRSNKGRPRLITRRRLVHSGRQHNPISPSYPSSEQDVQLALRMIERLRPLLPRAGALGDIAPTIEYFLTHVEANNSGVRFYGPKQAQPFVRLLANIADHRRTIFGVHVHSEVSKFDAAEQLAHWRTCLDIRIRSKKNRKSLKRDGGDYGKLTISLELPSQHGRPVSTHAYKYVLHLAAIALLSFHRIQIPPDIPQSPETTGDHEE